MGTTHRRGIGGTEIGAPSSYLATVLLGAWLLPGAWLSGATVGLGVGLLVAAIAHLRATREAADPCSTESHHPKSSETGADVRETGRYPVLPVLEPRFPTIRPDGSSHPASPDDQGPPIAHAS